MERVAHDRVGRFWIAAALGVSVFSPQPSHGIGDTSFVCSSSAVSIQVRRLQALTPEHLPDDIRVQKVPKGQTAVRVLLNGRSVALEFVPSDSVDRTLASPLWKQPHPVALVGTSDDKGMLWGRLYALVPPPSPDRAEQTIHGPKALLQLGHVARAAQHRRFPNDPVSETKDFLARLIGAVPSTVLECTAK